MILWELFSTFFGIGVVSFGGGYGMISLVREAVARNGWLAESEFLDFIAVSESTPGSLAVKMATFIGSSQAGVLGSLLATLGVVLPSFLAILLIAAVIRTLLKYGPVQAFLAGVRPCVVGMILSTAATMGLTTLLGAKAMQSLVSPDWTGILIFAILWGVHGVWKTVRKKSPSPIAMILLSAALGLLLCR